MLDQALRGLKSGRLYTQTGLELFELLYGSHELEQAADVIEKVKASDGTNPDVLYAAYRIHADLANETQDANPSAIHSEPRV